MTSPVVVQGGTLLIRMLRGSIIKLLIVGLLWGCFSLSVSAQRWQENNGKREWAQSDRSKIMVSNDLEMIGWPGLPDSTYFKIGIGLPSDSIWYEGDITNIELSEYYHARFYNIGDEALEWEAILYQKPGNQYRWTFPYESNNLRFYYQPELTQAEIDSGAIRPDSVVGSYAIYHSSKQNNKRIINGMDTTYENYRTGKAFHLYTPKAWDSAGDTVWLDLDIDTVAHEITLEGTRQWFRDAVYPVTIDPHFGYDGVGASAYAGSADDADVFFFPFTTSGEAGAIDSFAAYINDGTFDPCNYTNAIYEEDSNEPTARLATSVEFDSEGSIQGGWVVMEIDGSYSLVDATTYWLASGSDTRAWVQYDAAGTDDIRLDDGVYPPDENAASELFDGNVLRVSFYVVFTAAGAADAYEGQFIIIGGN